MRITKLNIYSGSVAGPGAPEPPFSCGDIHSDFVSRRAGLILARGCGAQISPTTGTVFHKSETRFGVIVSCKLTPLPPLTSFTGVTVKRGRGRVFKKLDRVRLPFLIRPKKRNDSVVPLSRFDTLSPLNITIQFCLCSE